MLLIKKKLSIKKIFLFKIHQKFKKLHEKYIFFLIGLIILLTTVYIQSVTKVTQNLG